MNQDDCDRIDGRKWAEECIGSLDGASNDYRLGFWRRLKRELLTREISPTAMTDAQRREFGTSLVEFGRYRGQRVDDVPLDYWEWFTDENTKVRRYLENRRIMAERETH